MANSLFGDDLRLARDTLAGASSTARRAVDQATREQVTRPLAETTKRAATHPTARAAARSVKAAFALGLPSVKVGGGGVIASGGATGGNLFYGSEFGANDGLFTYRQRMGKRKRITKVTRHIYRGYPAPNKSGHWFNPTLQEEWPKVSDRWAEVFYKAIEEAL